MKKYLFFKKISSFLIGLFLITQLLFPKYITAATCGNEGELCCTNNTCNQGLTCQYAGDQLHVYLCFDEEDYKDFTNDPKMYNLTVDLNKIFCISSSLKDGATNNPSSGKIFTAIGCIPVTGTPEFAKWILGWALGIGGGISLMLIIVSSFQIISSSGNPEKVQAGKELLTSAIAGLIMLIFSIFILKVIGVDILKLPGLK